MEKQCSKEANSFSSRKLETFDDVTIFSIVTLHELPILIDFITKLKVSWHTPYQ